MKNDSVSCLKLFVRIRVNGLKKCSVKLACMGHIPLYFVINP